MPCHLRVQNIGLKTRDVLMLVPETTVESIERCSGHNGTYGGEAGVPRGLDEDRPAGRATRRGMRSADSLFERLPDGRATRSRPVFGIAAAAAARADASAEAAAHGLRNLSAMKKLAHPRRPDVASSSTRASAPEFRARVLEHKTQPAARASGRTPPGLFEDRLTVQYQVQEMLRTERIFEAEGSRRSSTPTTR